MPTLYSTMNETGNRNRILGMCKIRFWLVHWIDPRSIEHNYACFVVFLNICTHCIKVFGFQAARMSVKYLCTLHFTPCSITFTSQLMHQRLHGFINISITKYTTVTQVHFLYTQSNYKTNVQYQLTALLVTKTLQLRWQMYITSYEVTYNYNFPVPDLVRLWQNMQTIILL